jgi:hypothetical protein
VSSKGNKEFNVGSAHKDETKRGYDSDAVSRSDCDRMTRTASALFRFIMHSLLRVQLSLPDSADGAGAASGKRLLNDFFSGQDGHPLHGKERASNFFATAALRDWRTLKVRTISSYSFPLFSVCPQLIYTQLAYSQGRD